MAMPKLAPAVPGARADPPKSKESFHHAGYSQASKGSGLLDATRSRVELDQLTRVITVILM